MKRPPFTALCEQSVVLFGISPAFARLSQTRGQITHVLLTRSPRYSPAEANFPVRLACVMHAASVCSEPGSNSPIGKFNPLISGVYILWLLQSLNPKVSKHVCLVFKEQPPRGEEINNTRSSQALSSPFLKPSRFGKNDTTLANIAVSFSMSSSFFRPPANAPETRHFRGNPCRPLPFRLRGPVAADLHRPRSAPPLEPPLRATPFAPFMPTRQLGPSRIVPGFPAPC